MFATVKLALNDPEIRKRMLFLIILGSTIMITVAVLIFSLSVAWFSTNGSVREALIARLKAMTGVIRHYSSAKSKQFNIDIVKKLKMKVTQEGVETLEDFDRLRKLGCDVIQGFYYSVPLPYKEYRKFVQERATSSYNPTYNPDKNR